MKICILAPRFPFPELAGDVLRINNIGKYLKNNGHTVILLTYYTGSDKEKYKDMLRQSYDKVFYVKRNVLKSLTYSFFTFLLNKPIQIGYYFSFAYLLAFRNIIKFEKPDLFVSHLLRMAPYLNICHLQNKSIIEMTDALSRTYYLSWKISGLNIKGLIYRLEMNRIRKYENKIIGLYKKCILVSEVDKVFLGNKRSIYVYTNGVRRLLRPEPEYNDNKIVFIGNMRTLQNQDAVRFFVLNIFPIVKQSIPGAVFYIIGAEPSLDIKRLADGKNIIVRGFVESVEVEIKDAAVAVASVRIAAGIQNKVLVSMACGIPVVLTSLISTGIGRLVSGKNCIISDKAVDFANSVISIMENRILRNQIGRGGYELVKNEYSWAKQLNGYEEGII
jgi:glycosyltransferase involved in cell wall biosynthesis